MTAQTLRPWLALSLIGWVQGRRSELDPEQIEDAIRQQGGVLEGPIHEIDLSQDGIAYGDWDHARHLLRERLAPFEARMRAARGHGIGVFGFASIPQLADLGGLLGNERSRIRVFPRHHDTTRGLRWLASTADAAPYDPAEPVGEVRGHRDIALIVEVSGQVRVADVVEVMEEQGLAFDAWRLRAPRLGYEVLEHEGQLRAFVRAYQEAARLVHEGAGAPRARLHLFSFVPIPVAIELGRQLPRGLFEQINLYEFTEGRYTFAFDLCQVPEPPVGSPAGINPQSRRVFLATNAPMPFRFVQGGRPRVGRLERGLLPWMVPQRSVLVESIFVAETPVTQAQWEAVRRSGWGELPENPSTHQDPRCPVTNVTWWDALRFANALSQLEGLAPAYALEGDEARLTGARGFRLPLEVEWEHASSSAREHEASPTPQAWTALDAPPHPQPVGAKSPNARGLYDMQGNVWEWCQDAWDPGAYARWGRGPQVRSVPGELLCDGVPVSRSSHTARVVRGGCWDQEPCFAHPAVRLFGEADEANAGRGFRLVLAP
ncbi:MAG: SUMF1/EgtB/PvdO family nonheme iron enzyme [Alphaproteobacteria bacterium]|nr:SUMF1/EgtB/PvdO family nonheme iron enzyme [Alphaproteobacteria bacterium]